MCKFVRTLLRIPLYSVIRKDVLVILPFFTRYRNCFFIGTTFTWSYVPAVRKRKWTVLLTSCPCNKFFLKKILFIFGQMRVVAKLEHVLCCFVIISYNEERQKILLVKEQKKIFWETIKKCICFFIIFNRFFFISLPFLPLKSFFSFFLVTK